LKNKSKKDKWNWLVYQFHELSNFYNNWFLLTYIVEFWCGDYKKAL
jgi:hypothetical protein